MPNAAGCDCHEIATTYNPPAPCGAARGRGKGRHFHPTPRGKRMAEAANPEFPTILGPDATFKGELSFEKGMRLMGRLEGKVSTPGRIHITKEAKMQADVEAGGITVEGEVQGNLQAADRIELKNSAR